jgi:hypothetical protein
MKKYFFAMGILCCLFASCDKDNSTTPPSNSEVKYEVITSSGEWFGEWFDKAGKREVMTQAPWNKSNWTLTFTPDALPFEMMCQATTTCICKGTDTSPSVTVNLYVGGKLVKSETNNFAKGVTTAVFKIEK